MTQVVTVSQLAEMHKREELRQKIFNLIIEFNNSGVIYPILWMEVYSESEETKEGKIITYRLKSNVHD